MAQQLLFEPANTPAKHTPPLGAEMRVQPKNSTL
jgi:hypothetical protein